LESEVSQIENSLYLLQRTASSACFPTASHMLPAIFTLIGPLDTLGAYFLKIDFDMSEETIRDH